MCLPVFLFICIELYRLYKKIAPTVCPNQPLDTAQSPDRLPRRNNVTSDKMNFRSDIRQICFKRNQDTKSFCGS